jgi:uncharacterized protein YbdZ (MbtH family)
MLDNIQIISEQGQAQFAVIDFEEYQYLKSLWSDEEQLEDYWDYLHMQKVKPQSSQRLNFEEVRQIL